MKTGLIFLGLAALASISQALIKRETEINELGVKDFNDPDIGKSYDTGPVETPEIEIIVQEEPGSSEGVLYRLKGHLVTAGNFIDKTGDLANRIIALPYDAVHKVVRVVGLDDTLLGKVAEHYLDAREGALHTKVNLISGVAQAPFKIASMVLEKEKREKRSVQSVAAQCCANSGLIGSIQQELSFLRASVNSFDQRLNGLIAKLSQI